MTSETLQPRESKQISVLRSWTKKGDKYLTITQIQQHEAVSRRCSSVSFLEAITKACNMALPFQFADKILRCDHVKKATERHFGRCFGQQSKSDTIQMKASVQCFPIAPFIMLYKVIQIFQSVNEIWRGDRMKPLQNCVLFVLFVQYVAVSFESVGVIPTGGVINQIKKQK